MFDGKEKWAKHVKQYRLPNAESWVINPKKNIVICLNKCGGWRCDSVDKFVDLFSGIVSDIRDKLPGYNIIIRPHPKTRNCHMDGVPKLLARIKSKGIHAAVDARSIERQAKITRAVVATWGTAATEFISRGVPVVNVSTEDPEGFIADPVALKDVKDVAGLETHRFPMTPRQFMESLAEYVFSPDEVESGDMMKYINSYYDSLR